MAFLVTSGLGCSPAALSQRQRLQAIGRERLAGRKLPLTKAIAQPQLFPQACQASRKQRVFNLMADYLEAQAAVNVFERLAGRAAMIGFAVATGAEVLLPGPGTGLFGSVTQQGDMAGQLAALGLLLLCCSVGLAARTYRPVARRHRKLLEPVLCSLTSGRRSFSGVTQRNVDRGVDFMFDSVFTQPFVSANLLDEDQYI